MPAVKLIWITPDGTAVDVVCCHSWEIDGATLRKAATPETLVTDCLGLQLFGVPCALCVACAMYLEHLTAEAKGLS